MHGVQRRTRRIVWPVVAALCAVLALTVPASAGDTSAGQQPALDRKDRAAAAQLAEDQGVSGAEARRRIAAQDELGDLATKLRRKLGTEFGGAWIDHDNGGRLTVAVTRKGAAADIRSAAAAERTTPPATVVVDRSSRQLDRMARALAERIVKANKGAGHGLQSAVVTERNALRLDLPHGEKLTEKQRKVVRWAKHEFGDALLTDTYEHASKPLYCNGQYSCDPPLRSGLAIYGNNIRCSSAFMVYDAYDYYMLTAGHCAEASSYWEVPTYSYGYQTVGSVADYRFGYYGDSAIVRITDSGWWQPRGWVYPSQAIRSWDHDYAGQYVCKTGSTTGYTCGRITETNATVSYPSRTLTGMTWSTACVDGGDSGSGVYDGSTAHGILSGGPSSGCGMIHEPIDRALSAMGVTLLSG